MRTLFACLLLVFASLTAHAQRGDPPAERGNTPRRNAALPEHRLPLQETTFRVLVFTRTLNFRHDSIQAGVEALATIGTVTGFSVDWTEDPARFSAEGLAPYDVVVFLNTTGDVLAAEQEAAFEAYLRGGGGYVGVHAASDTEYDWPFYKEIVGAYFKTHPAVQGARVNVSAVHAEEADLPEQWIRIDEWYDFQNVPSPDFEILASLDPTSYEGSTMSGPHPIAWRRPIDQGRAAYTAMGHTKESYDELRFRTHLAALITWARGEPGEAKPEAQGEPGASLFGVEASGQRFAYLIDVSGSMAYEGKIEALRAQLASSLEGLAEDAEFSVVLFSNGAFPLGGREGWIETNPWAKAHARQSINSLTPAGGTFPEEAFVAAFNLTPRPDAIYFLTDGEFDPAVVTTVNSVNTSPTIPIHCISFVNPGAGAAMKQIAQASGGTYTHVPEPPNP